MVACEFFYMNTILILVPISPSFSDNEAYRLQNSEQHQQHFLPLHLSCSALSIFLSLLMVVLSDMIMGNPVLNIWPFDKQLRT